MPADPTLTQEDLGLLKEGEIALIWMLRTKYRWGKVEIEVTNGEPTFLSRTVERDKLGQVKLTDVMPK